MIDLHTHSTFSDGSLTPEELAAQAAEIGLRAVALTDHDCTDGVPRFLAACAARGVAAFAGVEISADVPRGTLHVLGYGIAPGHPELEATLARIRQGREIRNREILRRLQGLGLDLSWEEVASRAGEDVVGRPHFAQALQARGYVASKDEAFERYLAKGKPAYVDRLRLTPEASIAAIRAAGGLAALAHPFTLELQGAALRAALAEWRAQGLEGLEAYYPEHSPEQTRLYLELARELDLAPTGGSDFHGAANPAVHLGRGFGQLCVPDELAEELQRRLRARA